uniref:Uncharacterized protein n=1 Tax=Timema shepardi TaxID=629360 RepID=A0A7R9G7N2_TIMSH|nr:unnamed protein product [Timema shepardi]
MIYRKSYSLSATGRTTPWKTALMNYCWDETCLDQGTGQLPDDVTRTPRFQMMPSHYEDSGSDNPANKQGSTKRNGPNPTWCSGHVAHTYIGFGNRRQILLKKSKNTGTSYKYAPASPREDAAHIHTVGDDSSQQV